MTLRRFAFAFALLFAAPAFAQQFAQQYTCTALLDGGSTNAICGTFLSNYSPYTLTCEVSVTGGQSAAATANVLVSGNGTNYGTWADAGLAVTIIANGDGGTVVTTAALAVSPTDPWLNSEVYVSGLVDDGGTNSTGFLTCQISVIQSQTLHSAHPAGFKTKGPPSAQKVQ
jgi:hypothetical protein